MATTDRRRMTAEQMPASGDATTSWWKKWWGIAAIAFGVFVAIGLAGVFDEEDLPDEAPLTAERPDEASADEEPADPCPVDGDRRTVNAQCVEPWPLAVDSGEVWCDSGSIDLPYVDADGTTWGLTGAAYTQGEGRELDDGIWADNPDIDGTKINISALRDAADELC